jgi:hypothetical protein
VPHFSALRYKHLKYFRKFLRQMKDVSIISIEDTSTCLLISYLSWRKTNIPVPTISEQRERGRDKYLRPVKKGAPFACIPTEIKLLTLNQQPECLSSYSRNFWRRVSCHFMAIVNSLMLLLPGARHANSTGDAHFLSTLTNLTNRTRSAVHQAWFCTKNITWRHNACACRISMP